MKVLYFDCSLGISGDTALGALLDMGIDGNELKNRMSGLSSAVGYDLVIEKKVMGGITGTEAKINMAAGCRYERSIKDIPGFIENSRLPDMVKDISKRVFNEFVEQAKKQNVTADLWLGGAAADRTLLSIVGCAICMDILGIEKVYSSPVCDGKAFRNHELAHTPVQDPGIAEIPGESSIPFSPADADGILMAVAGVALVKTLSTYFGNMPAIIIDRVAHGITESDEGGLKLLRVVMGELFGENNVMEEFAVIGGSIEDSAETATYAGSPISN